VVQSQALLNINDSNKVMLFGVGFTKLYLRSSKYLCWTVIFMIVLHAGR